MNDEIKTRYVPTDTGNALPNLNKHPAHNEPPVPINRPRTDPSRAMSDSPMKHFLPAGPELKDIIRRRLESKPLSAPALWASLNQSYQTRPRQEQALIDAVAGMLTDGELEQRDGKLHVAEPETPVPEKPESIDPAMWTMTHTRRVLHVLGTEPMTREALSRATGLKPRQVSKAAYLLIQQGYIEVVGDVPRTWRLTDSRPVDTEPETAVLTEEQTRAVVLERVSGVCDADVVIADVMRLSGWDRDEVCRLIDDLGTEGELIGVDGSISRPMQRAETSDADVIVAILDAVDNGYHDEAAITLGVGQRTGWIYSAMYPLIDDMVNDSILMRVDGKLYRHGARSEDPPPYEIGGEIPEPGIGRPVARHVPDGVVVMFVRTDDAAREDKYSVELDADGLCFGGGEVLSFEAIDAVMPILRRVHRAVFGGVDALE